ncbi:SWIM zinc finger family protein [Streptomyces sp. NPDC001054]
MNGEREDEEYGAAATGADADASAADGPAVEDAAVGRTEEDAASAAESSAAALARAALRQAPRPAPLGPAARARARRAASAAAARRREAAEAGDTPADRVRAGLRRAGEPGGYGDEAAPEAPTIPTDRPRPADAARAALRDSRRGAAVRGDGTAAARTEGPATEGERRAFAGERPASEAETPGSQGETSLSKGETPASDDETPASEGGLPTSRGEKGLSTGEAPAADDAVPADRAAADRAATDEPAPAVVPGPPRPRPEPAPAARPADLARAALRHARARQPAPEPPEPAPRTPRGAGPAPVPARAPDSAPVDPAARPPRPAAPTAAPAGARRTYRPDTATGAGAPGTPWSEGWERAVAALAAEPGRLARAREYLREGRVGTVTLTPGTALTYVRGGRARPYRVSLRTHHVPEPAWERLTDACAARADRLAVLLDGGLPGALAGAEGAGLLPGPGEPVLDCACPDPVRPCKHGLALALRLTGLLAEEPQALLLLRGRDPGTFTAELSRRHARLAARGDAGATALPGVKAAEWFGREPGPLPPPLPVPEATEPPPAYPAGTSVPDPLTLDRLASDAGARALALLRTGTDPLAGHGVWEDAVRLAAEHPGTGLTGTGRALYTRLARAAGAEPGALHRAVAAWRGAGAAGLRALEDPPWNPPAGPFDRARSLLLAAGHPPYRPHDNRLTSPDGTRQLRMDREGTWYAYESEPGAEDWWPRGTAAKDPAAALESAEPERDEEEDEADWWAEPSV